MREITTGFVTPKEAEPVILTKRIGSTTYEVGVHFSATSTETMNDKILRLVRNGTLTSVPEYGILEPLQTGRLTERGTL